MSVSELCIRRPVMTTLLALALGIIGVFSYFRLPIAALPKVDFPTISVTASLPGASPEVMSSSVAAILERQFSSISGVTSMTSVSSLGATSITLQFDLDHDIDEATLDVQAGISAAMRQLPSDISSPPSFRKVNPSDQPILFLALTGSNLALSKITEFAETVVQQRISQVTGVAQVQIFGSQKFAIRILARPDAVTARGISFEDIRETVSAANSNQPTGVLKGERQRLTISSNNQMLTAEDYASLTIRTENNNSVRLGDVATVYESVENDQVASWLSRDRSILLAIYRQSDANTVAVIDTIKEKLDGFRAQLPGSVKLEALNDRSLPIRNSISELQYTLLISIILVVFVVFLFLKSFSATLIPVLAIPISILGTFAVMALLGSSLNIISMLALTLAVGFVVDDAIVMLENITRHQENGTNRLDSALKGSKEIGFTIISITFSLIAVFIPVFFMGGVVGKVFSEFATVISVAILISGLVSLTLTPMMCSRISNSPFKSSETFGARYIAKFTKIFEYFAIGYRKSLDLAFKFKNFVILLTIISIGMGVKLYIESPKGLFPSEDTGLVRLSTQGPLDISFEAMSAHQRTINELILNDPAVAYVSSSVGFGSLSQGFGFIQLRDVSERDDIQAVITRLRKATSGVVGVTSIFQSVQNVNLSSGRQSRSQFQYSLQSADLKELFEGSARIVERMQTMKELQDVISDAQISNPVLMVDVDRTKAAYFGINNDQIRKTLFDLFGSRQISTIYTETNDYAVILESDRIFQSDPDAVASLVIRNRDGVGVPIGTVAKITKTVGPVAISRQSQLPSVTISFNLSPGVALGTAIDAIRSVEDEIGLGSQVYSRFSGAAQILQETSTGQGALIVLALLFIYLVLGILYESFIHPITILSGLPSAGIGALLALKFMSIELSVMAFIGILLLLGLVKKNAIMMIDFAIDRRRSGDDALSAIREAALIRFRPIMMTTFAALFGALPIAFGIGSGSEFMQPLGVTIVGGILMSQVLTLYVTPIIYVYLDGLDRFLRKNQC
ncbi:MAG: efflux RND transporter permease subunit [Hyphomicrobiales bacterium]